MTVQGTSDREVRQMPYDPVTECARCGGLVLPGDEDRGVSYRKDDGTQQEYGALKPLRHKSGVFCLVYVLRKSTIVAVPDRFLT